MSASVAAPVRSPVCEIAFPLEEVVSAKSRAYPEIARLVEHLQTNRVGVYFVPRLPGRARRVGTYLAETREILVAVCVGLTDAEILMTLAHEAGHWMGYQVFPETGMRNREIEAYVFGWQLLRRFGSSITREQWRADCREAWAAHREVNNAGWDA